ncbi:MAG: cytochrome c [Halioglobus sp.]|nr:cytochrome c [Halioglobus sp.]
MPISHRTALLGLSLAAGLALSPLAVSHFNDKEILQSYRQSWFAMVATNFGPMVAMLKGDMPWDEQRLAENAKQLVQLTEMDISRGFSPGSEKGTTRAKPGIWENRDDFNSKMADLKEAAAALQTAVAGGDRKTISQAIAATGDTCSACHDEYQAEEYLY